MTMKINKNFVFNKLFYLKHIEQNQSSSQVCHARNDDRKRHLSNLTDVRSILSSLKETPVF
jgi:hypothetical protein